MKVLIDGENFRHQIAAALVDSGHLHAARRNAFFKFDLESFLYDVLGEPSLEIVYYTTKIKQPNFSIPQRLVKKLQVINEANRKWVAFLTNQGVRIVKAGYLRVRESSACIHCSKKTLVLQEKGVDVRVATDLVLTAMQGDPVVLISSDSDIVPALEAAKRKGSAVTYLCPASRLNASIATMCTKVITFDNKKVTQYYRGK